ncbi:hypothetical protein LZ554_008043 [Drepanopeziza brunnea f. sp. 'monogermtubi']|nr:hypothetical protein LZ554_008043 [Drepanopeziza brunnea f. sp. 'monogermtubi']
MVARSVSLLAALALSANANYLYKFFPPQPEAPATNPYVAAPYDSAPVADVTTSSALPAYSATKDCEKVRADCQSQPGANQAVCSALFAECAGTTNDLNKPVASSTQSSIFPAYSATKDCEKVRADCQSQPGANQAFCSALFAECVGTTSGLNKPVASSTQSSSVPVYSATKDCEKVRADCQSQPGANQAVCSALFAECAGTTNGLNKPVPSSTTPCATSSSTAIPEKSYAPYGPGPVAPAASSISSPVPSVSPPSTQDCHEQYTTCREGNTHLSTCVAQLLSCKKYAMNGYLEPTPSAPSKEPSYPASSDCQAQYDECRGTGDPNLSACVAEFEACKNSEEYVPVQSLQHAPATSSAPVKTPCSSVIVKSSAAPVPSGTYGTSDCQAQYDACRSTGSPNLSACVAQFEACKSGEVKSYPAPAPIYTSKNATQPAGKPTKAPVPSGTSDCQAKYDACRSTGSPNLSACVAQFEACKNSGDKSYPAVPVAPVYPPAPSGASDCQAKYDACRSTGSPNLSACVAQFEACKNGGAKSYPGVVPMYPAKNSTRPAFIPTGAPVPTGTYGPSDCQAKYDACRSTGSPNLSACVAQFEACQAGYYPGPPVVKTQDVTVYTTVCPETAYLTYGTKVVTSVYQVTKTLTITSCPGGPCEATPVPNKSYPVAAPPAMTYTAGAPPAPPAPPAQTYPAQGPPAPPAPPAQTYPAQGPPAPPVVKTQDVTVYTTVCPETSYITTGTSVITTVYKVTSTLTITSCPGGCEPTPVPVKTYPVGAPPAQTYPVQAPPAPPAQGPPAGPPAQGPPAPPAKTYPVEAPPAKTYPVGAPPAETYPVQAPPAPPAQGPPAAPPAQGPPAAPPAQGPPAAPPAKTYPGEAPPAQTYPAQGPPAPPAQGPPAAPPAQGPPAAPPAKTYPGEAPPAQTYPAQGPPAPPAPPAKTYPVEAPPAKTYPATLATTPVGTAPGAPVPTSSQYSFTGAASTLQVGSVGLLSVFAFVFLL